MSAVFRIARNPDEDSTLPYLLWVPVGSTPLVLKAKESWQRTAKVYCHRGEWPHDADVVEETPVRSCVRRGVAIDLVLDRYRENRSQFVVTVLGTAPSRCRAHIRCVRDRRDLGGRAKD